MTTTQIENVRRQLTDAMEGVVAELEKCRSGEQAIDSERQLMVVAGGSLEDVQAVGDSLVIRFSEDKTLTLDHPARAFVENSELVFDGFRQATLRWKYQGVGPDAPYSEERYDAGQVRLVPPLGTTVDLS